MPIPEQEIHALLASTSPITDEAGQVTGAVVISQDPGPRGLSQPPRSAADGGSPRLLSQPSISGEQVEAERERDDLNRLLSGAMAQVQVFEGMLSMCAGCGKVRDSEGHWERIDWSQVMRKNFEVSHGICDECARELYPDYVARLAARTGR